MIAVEKKEKGRNRKPMEEEKYYHWIYSIEGIGNKTLRKILEVAEPKQIFEEGTGKIREILVEEKLHFIEEKRKKHILEEEWDKLRKEGIRVSFYGSSSYPSKLKHIPDPPMILYQKGEPIKENSLSVAVVGARNCSSYGKMMARNLGKELARNGITVVSGMARGIDGISQWAALEEGGKSIGVLGCGVQICYPPENFPLYQRLERSGGVLSENLPYTKPAPGLFPRRNRLISGLADVIVVIEAREKSGTLITVDMALEQGKEVYCVPGRVTDDLSIGCNHLIKMGAGMIVSAEEFVEEICKQQNWSYEKQTEKQEETLEKQEKLILEALDTTPLFMDEIIKRIRCNKKEEIPLQKLMEILLQLQIKQKICQEGQYYYKK